MKYQCWRIASDRLRFSWVMEESGALPVVFAPSKFTKAQATASWWFLGLKVLQ